MSKRRRLKDSLTTEYQSIDNCTDHHHHHYHQQLQTVIEQNNSQIALLTEMIVFYQNKLIGLGQQLIYELESKNVLYQQQHELLRELSNLQNPNDD